MVNSFSYGQRMPYGGGGGVTSVQPFQTVTPYGGQMGQMPMGPMMPGGQQVPIGAPVNAPQSWVQTQSRRVESEIT